MRALFVLFVLFVGGVAASIVIDFVAHDAVELPGFDYVADQGAIGAVAVLAALNVSVGLLGTIVNNCLQANRSMRTDCKHIRADRPRRAVWTRAARR